MGVGVGKLLGLELKAFQKYEGGEKRIKKGGSKI